MLFIHINVVNVTQRIVDMRKAIYNKPHIFWWLPPINGKITARPCVFPEVYRVIPGKFHDDDDDDEEQDEHDEHDEHDQDLQWM